MTEKDLATRVDMKCHPDGQDLPQSGNEAAPASGDDGYPYDDEDNEQDDDDFDCHRGPDGSCGMAGTEECDWQCPYNRR